MRLITEKMDTLKNQRDRSRALEEHISDQKEKLDLKKENRKQSFRTAATVKRRTGAEQGYGRTGDCL